MINAHIIDARGVYLRTETVDPMGPQPAGAVYGVLLEAREGFTRMRRAGVWVQVPDADVPLAPEPVPPPDLVPASCTRRQGLRALISYGFMPSLIEALIAQIPDEVERELARVDYEAATWERADESLQAVWAQLGGTPEQLDDLFRLAVTI